MPRAPSSAFCLLRNVRSVARAPAISNAAKLSGRARSGAEGFGDLGFAISSLHAIGHVLDRVGCASERFEQIIKRTMAIRRFNTIERVGDALERDHNTAMLRAFVSARFANRARPSVGLHGISQRTKPRGELFGVVGRVLDHERIIFLE